MKSSIFNLMALITTLTVLSIPTPSRASGTERLSMKDFAKVYHCGPSLVGINSSGKFSLGKNHVTDSEAFVYGDMKEPFDTLRLFKPEASHASGGHIFTQVVLPSKDGYILKQYASSPGKGQYSAVMRFNTKDLTLTLRTRGKDGGAVPFDQSKSHKCKILRRESAFVGIQPQPDTLADHTSDGHESAPQ